MPLFRQRAHTDKRPTDKEPLQTLCNSYRQRDLTDNLGPLQRIRGPYRQGTMTLCNSYRQAALSLQTRGNYRQRAPTGQGPPHARDSYRRCAISTDKGPLQTNDPYIIYMQGREGLLQTRAPVSKGPYMKYSQKGPIQVCRESLKIRAHPDMGPLQKMAPTDKATLNTHFIQLILCVMSHSKIRLYICK